MTLSKKKYESRSIISEIQVTASIDEVWRALTDPLELVQWFPLEARVNPGAGGSVWLSWGEPNIAEWTIDAWEPRQQLRGTEVKPLGAALEPPEAKYAQRTIVLVLESSSGMTTVRLMHSGFGVGPQWTNVYSAVHRGWQFQLCSLRHYLERHHGARRLVAHVYGTFRFSVEEIWAHLIGREGVPGSASLLEKAEGDSYSIYGATGDLLRGIVLICDPPMQFVATVTNMNDSLLRIYLVDHTAGAIEAHLWLASYGTMDTEIQAFEERWKRLFRGLFR